MADPEFSPGAEHTAHALMMNNTPRAWTYNAELYLVKAGTKYTSSGMITFSLAAGASRTIDFPISMPDIEGTYKVYLDVYVAGELIAAYQAIEDVTIVAAVPVFSYSNMELLTPRIPGEVEYYVEVSCDIKNIGGGGTREVSLWIMSPRWDSGYWIKVTRESFLGWEAWAIPPGIWNAGTIMLTLAPGETFHFHYAGRSSAWHDYTYAQLRDAAGGESVIVKKYSG